MTGISSSQGPGGIQSYNYLTSQNKAEKSTPVAVSRSADRVDISAETQLLLGTDNAENASGSARPLGKKILKEAGDYFNYMLNNLEEITAEFKKDLKCMLKNAGVDCDKPFELTTARDGSVKVVGDHPDKAAIEQFFTDNPEMRNRFAGISATTSLKRAIEMHMEFAKAYEKDPKAAVARYFPMFEMMKRQGYTMSLGGEQAKPVA